MGLIDLFVVASLPVVKVLLITALGLFLALDSVDILGENARHHLNKVVFYVFNPSLLAGNLAKPSLLKGFLPSLVGTTALGYLLVKVTKVPKHLKGLIIGACSAGNLGNMLIILVPAMCKEKGSPFGAPDVCETYALSYASLSMAIGAVYLWLYVYNVVRVTASEVAGETDTNYEALLPSTTNISSSSVKFLHCYLNGRLKRYVRILLEKINAKAIFAPSTIAVVLGFAIGMMSLIRNLMIDNDAPLHVIMDSALLLGDAAIPTVTLKLGANLLQGLKDSSIQPRVVIGIVVSRYIILPLLGILIVKGAIQDGFVPFNNKLFVFVLLVQFALPPAINFGTMTQLFGAGQSERSVIMLWTYSLASVSLTLWSTLFL